MADWSEINQICDDIIKNGSYKENLVDIVWGDYVIPILQREDLLKEGVVVARKFYLFGFLKIKEEWNEYWFSLFVG